MPVVGGVRLTVIPDPSCDAEDPAGGFARVAHFALKKRPCHDDLRGFVLQHVRRHTEAYLRSSPPSAAPMTDAELAAYTHGSGFNEEYYEFFPVDRVGRVRFSDQFAAGSIVPFDCIGKALSAPALRCTTRGTITIAGEATYYRTAEPIASFLPRDGLVPAAANGLPACYRPPRGLPEPASNRVQHVVQGRWGDAHMSSAADPEGDIYTTVQETICEVGLAAEHPTRGR
jgi:hypothetical protein